MIKTKTVTVTQEEIEDIFCNKCGKSCKKFCDYEGLIEAEFTGGYDSKLGDGNMYRFSLCEDCLAPLFKKFIHSPLATSQLGLGTV
jgi:hypothetical protein